MPARAFPRPQTRRGGLRRRCAFGVAAGVHRERRKGLCSSRKRARTFGADRSLEGNRDGLLQKWRRPFLPFLRRRRVVRPSWPGSGLEKPSPFLEKVSRRAWDLRRRTASSENGESGFCGDGYSRGESRQCLSRLTSTAARIEREARNRQGRAHRPPYKNRGKSLDDFSGDGACSVKAHSLLSPFSEEARFRTVLRVAASATPAPFRAAASTSSLGGRSTSRPKTANGLQTRER